MIFPFQVVKIWVNQVWSDNVLHVNVFQSSLLLHLQKMSRKQCVFVSLSPTGREMCVTLKSWKTPKRKRGRPYGMMQLLPNIQGGYSIICLALHGPVSTCRLREPTNQPSNLPKTLKVGLTALQWWIACWLRWCRIFFVQLMLCLAVVKFANMCHAS